MKKVMFLVLLAISFTAQSQKLKDLLYGGKLKLDSNTVVRKGDDLSTKIDTSTKKPVEVVKPTSAPIQQTTVEKQEASVENTTATVTTTTVAEPVAEDAVTKQAAPVKSNNKLWKEYIDSLSQAMKTDLGSLKKLKKGDYFVTVQYEIGLDGQVNILNVVADPENSLLQSEVKNRLELSVPKLAPVTDSGGKVRKVKRTSNFTITKE